jgi:hypothetical protein
MKRRMAVLAILAVALVARLEGTAAASVPPPPENGKASSALSQSRQTPGPAEPHVLTANLAGGCTSSDSQHCPPGGSGVQQANALLAIAFNGTMYPVSIMVQEICSHSAWVQLRDWLTYQGYQNAEHRDDEGAPGDTVCGTSTRWFGSAVFWVGGCYGGQGSPQCRSRIEYPSSMQASGEERGFVCGRGAFIDYWACSSHLTFNTVGQAQLQAEHWRVSVNLLRLLQPAALVGGDFNLIPSQDTAFENQSSYSEAHCRFILVICTTFQPHSGAEKTLDYAYATTCRTRNGSVFDNAYSDHHVLQGFFSFC